LSDHNNGDSGPADSPPVRADEAYSKILGAIRSGTLTPGARVREVHMAEWLQMSRTPVRQAIQRLESEGLLTLEPRIGLVVSQVDADYVAELYSMREVLEGTAARLAAESASRADLHVLQELVHAELQSSPNPEFAAESNRRFHTLVYRAAKNRFLLKSLRALHDSLALLGKSTLFNKARARQAAHEHAKIVEAIVARKPETAEELMRQHIRSAYRERLKLLFGTR
jgi:DNA-binding GntR family transcriptional regulator